MSYELQQQENRTPSTLTLSTNHTSAETASPHPGQHSSLQPRPVQDQGPPCWTQSPEIINISPKAKNYFGEKGEKEEVYGLNKRSIKLEESEELETLQI